jgi:uncharacterized membrane protein
VDPPRSLRVAPFATGFSFFRERQVPTLALLLALAGAVLLIACLNVNILTLARAAARRHELGIRIALGAGRARLLGGLLAEALLLAAEDSGRLLGLESQRLTRQERPTDASIRGQTMLQVTGGGERLC